MSNFLDNEILQTSGADAAELGHGAFASGANSIAIGAAHGTSADDTTNGAFATAANAIAVGAGAKATASTAVQIGAGTNNTAGTVKYLGSNVALVTSGTGAATAVDITHIGQLYVKTDTGKLYVAVGLTKATDWAILN
jgi:hypothetical protein